MLRDLRHHPLILGAELTLLVAIGALLVAHVDWQTRLAEAPRAFMSPEAEGALLERLSLKRAVYVNAEFRHHGRMVTSSGDIAHVGVPSSSPASILRLQPEDRRDAWESTPGLDFFLEGSDLDDGFGPVSHATLAEGGNGLVLLIDGNLWVHSHGALEVSLRAADGSPVRVTFVVRGNIYFLDDVRAPAPGSSLAFIALPAPTLVPSGGDIWLGDLAYGTLSVIDGYLFAAGDVHGALLDEGLVIHGALAAGGEIDVDLGEGCRRALLHVEHDLRYARGSQLPPGL